MTNEAERDSPTLGEGQPLGENQPLGERLFQQIVDIIHSGEFAPGSELNEALLAQRFGVSRGPVREALRRLQGVGLISRAPYLRARVVHLDAAQVVDLFQMREAMEGMACRLAAERMTGHDAARLLADLEADRREWTGGQQTVRDRSFDFHQRVVEGSQNQRIAETLNGDLHQLFRLYRRQSGADTQRKNAAYLEHWQIMRAIITRDPDLAESLMRSHVARAAANLVRATQDKAAAATATPARGPRRQRRSA
jgi:DNA-binding GntR family transcriptional regulator